MRWSYYVFYILVLFGVHALSHPVPDSSVEDSQYSTLSRRAVLRSGKDTSRYAPYTKTRQIRKSNARKIAIKHEEEKNPGLEFTSEQHGDHILELQAVTSHMNLHRDATAAKPGADADKCNARVKHDMNQRNNLAMIDATVNAQKGVATTALIHGKSEPGYSDEAKKHILKHQDHILNVASAVDATLASEECGKLPPGIVDHAKKMIAAAKKP